MRIKLRNSINFSGADIKRTRNFLVGLIVVLNLPGFYLLLTKAGIFETLKFAAFVSATVYAAIISSAYIRWKGAIREIKRLAKIVNDPSVKYIPVKVQKVHRWNKKAESSKKYFLRKAVGLDGKKYSVIFRGMADEEFEGKLYRFPTGFLGVSTKMLMVPQDSKVLVTQKKTA